MTSWDNARRHARALESALETKLASYSRLASEIGGGRYDGPGPSRDAMALEEEGVGGYKLVEEEVEELLGKFDQAITDLTTLINDPSQPPSASMQHAAQRHRENFDDYRRDFQRVRASVEGAVQRSNLLGSVRKDISDYNSKMSSQTDALLADRGRIDSSHRMMDDTLDQAYATRQNFAEQRSMLTSIESRIGRTASQIPGINSLISMISSRRRRDTYIIGGVIAICVLLLLGYMFGY